MTSSQMLSNRDLNYYLTPYSGPRYVMHILTFGLRQTPMRRFVTLKNAQISEPLSGDVYHSGPFVRQDLQRYTRWNVSNDEIPDNPKNTMLSCKGKTFGKAIQHVI